MKLYKNAKTKYINDVSGEGARLTGGKWNYPGFAARYTSEHRSLALLELIVHYNAQSSFNDVYSCMEFELDDVLITEFHNEHNSQIHNIFHDCDTSREIVLRYFTDLNALAIKAPCVIVPEEYNVVINPIHPEIDNLNIVEIGKVSLDNKILKG